MRSNNKNNRGTIFCFCLRWTEQQKSIGCSCVLLIVAYAGRPTRVTCAACGAKTTALGALLVVAIMAGCPIHTEVLRHQSIVYAGDPSASHTAQKDGRTLVCSALSVGRQKAGVEKSCAWPRAARHVCSTKAKQKKGGGNKGEKPFHALPGSFRLDMSALSYEVLHDPGALGGAASPQVSASNVCSGTRQRARGPEGGTWLQSKRKQWQGVQVQHVRQGGKAGWERGAPVQQRLPDICLSKRMDM